MIEFPVVSEPALTDRPINSKVLELSVMGLVTAAAPLIHCTKPEHTQKHVEQAALQQFGSHFSHSKE